MLQNSLEQVLDRAALEDASSVVQSVARADCVKLHRELFGIVVSGLPYDEAVAFQKALDYFGFPTTLVADDDLPILHDAYTFQRLERMEEVFNFTDAMGRTQTRLLDELVFLGGGFFTEIETEVKKSDWIDTQYSSHGSYPGIVTHRETRFHSKPRFLLDFFFSGEPNRLQVVLRQENVFFYQGNLQRLKFPDVLISLMSELRQLLPSDRLTSGLFQQTAKPAYPNFASYEEEVRWKFYQLMKES